MRKVVALCCHCAILIWISAANAALHPKRHSHKAQTSTPAEATTQAHPIQGVDLLASCEVQPTSANLPASPQITPLGDAWVRVSNTTIANSRQAGLRNELVHSLQADFNCQNVQDNTPIVLPEAFQIQDKLQRSAFARGLGRLLTPDQPVDNPAMNFANSSASTPHSNNQLIVAVVDTGVDYTHELLKNKLWHNAGEFGWDTHGHRKEQNQIDDDSNGFVDDVIGWDFVDADNHPYDKTENISKILSGEGQPGHGTHIAGSLSANVELMSLRAIGSNGVGHTSDVLLAIGYAIRNKANVLTKFWESEITPNPALDWALKQASNHNLLVISTQNRPNTLAAASCQASAATASNEICVAESESEDSTSSKDIVGPQVAADIYASGQAVPSSNVKNGFGAKIFNLSGFSMDWHGPTAAAQKVLHAVTEIWSNGPVKNWQDLKQQLQSLFNNPKHTSDLDSEPQPAAGANPIRE